jgi:hypothetical protein
MLVTLIYKPVHFLREGIGYLSSEHIPSLLPRLRAAGRPKP